MEEVSQAVRLVETGLHSLSVRFGNGVHSRTQVESVIDSMIRVQDIATGSYNIVSVNPTKDDEAVILCEDGSLAYVVWYPDSGWTLAVYEE